MTFVAHIWGDTRLGICLEKGSTGDVLRMQIGESGRSSATAESRKVVFYLHEFGRRRLADCLQEVLRSLKS